MSRYAFVLVLFAALLLARADDSKDSAAALKPYLEKGELLLVETKPDGTLGQTTSFASVAAPSDLALETLLDYESYPTWVPRVVKIGVKRPEADTFDVAYELDAPGKNYKYTIRFKVDREKRVIDGSWLAGDMKDGHWTWKFEPQDGKTIVTYVFTGDVSGQSRLLQALDDSQKTLSSGLGLASSFIMAKAAKTEIERRAKAKFK
jgi:ribosome-associated toxin RatA of RatAB toxin-antitoxin module